MHEKRQRNLAQMQAKTARILEGIERERISEPSPSVVVPLLDAAKDEGREDLQNLWAALLARALIDGGKTARKAFFPLLAALDFPDIIALQIIAGRIPLLPDEKIGSDGFLNKLKDSGMSLNAFGASKMVLVEQECLSEGSGLLTPWGYAFLEAVEIAPAPAPYRTSD